jgi:hypothetical protein
MLERKSTKERNIAEIQPFQDAKAENQSRMSHSKVPYTHRNIPRKELQLTMECKSMKVRYNVEATKVVAHMAKMHIFRRARVDNQRRHETLTRNRNQSRIDFLDNKNTPRTINGTPWRKKRNIPAGKAGKSDVAARVHHLIDDDAKNMDVRIRAGRRRRDDNERGIHNRSK